jgi:hypothetical protein
MHSTSGASPMSSSRGSHHHSSLCSRRPLPPFMTEPIVSPSSCCAIISPRVHDGLHPESLPNAQNFGFALCQVCSNGKSPLVSAGCSSPQAHPRLRPSKSPLAQRWSPQSRGSSPSELLADRQRRSEAGMQGNGKRHNSVMRYSPIHSALQSRGNGNRSESRGLRTGFKISGPSVPHRNRAGICHACSAPQICYDPFAPSKALSVLPYLVNRRAVGSHHTVGQVPR